MYCSTCGASVDNSADFCTTCGAPMVSSKVPDAEIPETEFLSDNYEETGRLLENGFTPIHENAVGGVPISEQQPFVQNPQQSYASPSFPVLDEKVFYKQFASKNTNGWVIAIVVVCFFTAAISIPSLVFGNLLSILDIVFYLIFGILLLLRKKWYFSLPVTIYSGIGTIITLAMAGAATGVLALIAGIISTIKLKKINAAYKQYKERGVLPQNVI